MANEDFTRLTGEETPLTLTPRAYSDITEEDASEEYVAQVLEDTETSREDAPPQSETEGSGAHSPIYQEGESVPFTKPKTMIFSIIALIFSAVSLIYGLSGFIGAIFGIVAVVFAIVSRVHLGYFDAKSVIALILGIVGTVFGVFVGVIDLLGIFNEAGGILGEIANDQTNDFNYQV